MENNAIYISDSESSNTVDAVNVAACSTAMVTCFRCNRTYPMVDAMKKHHRDMLIKKIIKIFMGGSLRREAQPDVSSSPTPRLMGAPAPRFLQGGCLHRFTPYTRSERNLSLPVYIDDPSGTTLDLLSQLNMNTSGSVGKPKSPSRAIINLDLKL